MSAWKPPGSDTLDQRFSRIERQINELTRRTGGGTQAAPVCAVRMVAAWDFSHDGENWRPTTSWANTPLIDTLGAYHYNTPSGTYWDLPYTGLYTIQVRSHWAGNPSLPNRVSTQLWKNGTSYSNMIMEETQVMSGSSLMSYNLLCQFRTFEAMDRIRVNFWSERRGARHRYENNQDWSHIFIRYEGTV